MKPSQVIDMQADLLSRFDDPMIQKMWVSQMVTDHTRGVSGPGVYTEEAARSNSLASFQAAKHSVRQGYAYYASEDMTKLVSYAASQLGETDHFNASIVPTLCGLVRFETPLPFTDVRGKLLNVSWAGWGPVWVDRKQNGGPPETAIAVWLWNDHFDQPDDIYRDLLKSFGMKDFKALELHTGRWGYIGNEIFYTGQRMGPAFIEPGDRKRAEVVAAGAVPSEFTNVMRLLTAFWMLLEQKVTAKDIETIPKAAQKRARRMNLPPRVTVIRLRSVESRRQPGETLVEWNHRWLTRAHWRWQPYGPRGHDHSYGETRVDGGVLVRDCKGCEGYVERIWIELFEKGPADKPLIVSEKVYALVR